MSTSADRSIRVGAVRYLNTKPLVFDLTQIAPNIDLVYDLPSRLAVRLADGQLDVALIPSVEALGDPHYTVTSDACIACRGPVWSVKLFSRVPPERIQTLALDEGSRTSVALVQILLHQRHGLRPTLQPLGIGQTAADSDADAVLLIGDRAIHPPAERFAAVWDLGDEWCRWSELPFVFAMWVARPGVDVQQVGAALSSARDAGMANLAAIAKQEAGSVGLTAGECLHYLRDNLHFDLGAKERDGLQLFYQRAAQLGLAPQDASLSFAAHELDSPVT